MDAKNTPTGRDITVTQADINEIQLAKGAVRAGIDTLLEATGTAVEDVEELILAGAFGSYLDLGNAIRIGLLPQLPHAVYRQVGNAAGIGAKAVLVSTGERTRARELASRTRYLELTSFPGFHRRFARSSGFAPLTPASTPTGGY